MERPGTAMAAIGAWRPTARLLLVLGAAVASPAWAQPSGCVSDVVAEVALDGRTLALRSGARFQVVPADAPVASLWLPGVEVSVCEQVLAVGDARLAIHEIRARDEPERVRALVLPGR